MAAAAIPALIKVGSMVGGSLLGKKLSKTPASAQAGMQMTQAAGGQLLGQAGAAAGTGASLIGGGRGYLQNAGDYYRRLLSPGGRGELRSAVAPEMSQLMDYYRGASSKAGRTLRGGSRDYALAELDRQKVGQMSMIPAMARANAAQGETTVGNSMTGSGANLFGTSVYGAASGGQAANSLFNQANTAADNQAKAGSAYGGLLHGILSAIPMGKAKGAGVLPSLFPSGSGDDTMPEGDGF